MSGAMEMGPAETGIETPLAPDQPATTFSQADLAAGKVLFVHDNGDAKSGGFDVSVTDRAGATIAPQRMQVTVVAPF